MIRLRSAIAASLIAATVVGCGSDDASSGADNDVDALREVIADFGETGDDADCVANELDGVIAPDELRTFLEAFESDDRDATSEDVAAAFAAAAETCGVI